MSLAQNSRLAFRDRLHADTNAAASYERLKTSLATQHLDDRDTYAAAKATFVQSLGS